MVMLSVLPEDFITCNKCGSKKTGVRITTEDKKIWCGNCWMQHNEKKPDPNYVPRPGYFVDSEEQ